MEKTIKKHTDWDIREKELEEREKAIKEKEYNASVNLKKSKIQLEKAEKEKGSLDEKEKKQLLLRLSPTLWEEVSRWAEDDFRSVNGQIEYILTEAVKKRRKVKIEEETEK